MGEFTVEHLWAAECWDDRYECLKWAVENRATVKEMQAWHRAQNGLDLFAEDQTAPLPPDTPVGGGLLSREEAEIANDAMQIASCDIRQWVQFAKRQMDVIPDWEHVPHAPTTHGVDASLKVLETIRVATVKLIESLRK